MNGDLELYDSPTEGKDYLVQVRIKNGPLMRAMRMRGYQTAAALAQDAGIPYASLINYMGLKSAPLTKAGKWSQTALNLAKCLRLPPDCLFPEQHLTEKLQKNTGELEMSREDIALVLEREPEPTAEQRMITDQVMASLTEAVNTLTPREQRVLGRRFGLDGEGEKSEKEIAEKEGVSSTRMHQIIARALFKLQHPAQLKKLAQAGCDTAHDALERLRVKEAVIKQVSFDRGCS